VTDDPRSLPLLAPATAPRERADAARNRERILAAATALVGERGIDHVSMDDVARAACVGTGTLYRRFGDRAGLAVALLDEDTRAFQDALIAGPPPLGPGAPPAERLRAFGDAWLVFLEGHADVLAAAVADSGGSAPEQLNLTHLTILLRQAAPAVDAEWTARALMAALHPGQFLHQRRDLGWPAERQAQAWHRMVGALCAAS
jgi:AcrR family transcriptional regulator